jgi:hypothetical protein
MNWACLKLGEVSLDGTKIEAKASKRAAMILRYAEQLEFAADWA